MRLFVSRIRNELELETGRYLNILVISDGETEVDVPVADDVFEHVMVTFREGMGNISNPANDRQRPAKPEVGELPGSDLSIPDLGSLAQEDEGREDGEEWIISEEEKDG